MGVARIMVCRMGNALGGCWYQVWCLLLESFENLGVLTVVSFAVKLDEIRLERMGNTFKNCMARG